MIGNDSPGQAVVCVTPETPTERGMPGSATVFADNAGVIGLIAKVLIWIKSYVAYI